MFRCVLLMLSLVLGVIVLFRTPTPEKEAGYPIQYTRWRASFREDGVKANVFASRLRIRSGTRTVYSVENGRRTASFPVSVAVVTNVSDRSLFYAAYGEGGPGYPTGAFDYEEELQSGIWVPTSASFCGTGLGSYELKPGQTVAFHVGSARTKPGAPRTRRWTVFSDSLTPKWLPSYTVESLTLLSDSGGL